MKRKRRDPGRRNPAPIRDSSKIAGRGIQASHWPGERPRYLYALGILLIAACTLVIYGQTVLVSPIDYEDPFYLGHSPYVHASTAFSRLGTVWTEPYFANFHPVTTTTWLIDRALADESKPFDGLPFRITQLLYAVLGAVLLIPLYRRLGLPAILAVLGALVYAAHPIHTEGVAWLSARKDLISLLFIILSFLAWLWAREAVTPNQWRLRHALGALLVLSAILSKPIAVILPALFVAYEFCSGPHGAILSWRWGERYRNPILTRTLALTAIFLAVGGVCAVIFRGLLLRDPMHGGWLIFVLVGLTLAMLALAPPMKELKAFREGGAVGIRVLSPPFVALSVMFGAGSAWTFWAQQQVGAIKGGLTLLPTLNLTFDAMLAYTGKTLVPAYMSASYTWNEYPYVSLRGLLGAALVGTAVWIAMRLAGAQDRNRRLIAFGIFWYLIALVPVANLVPTSTKMADRYLFVPTVGAMLSLLALAAVLFSNVRRRQFAVCAALMLVVGVYTAWAYRRTEVWCGKTTPWHGKPQPDLSLWTAAVETNPENTLALNYLALSYLRLNPPEADQALVYLNRALNLSEANQSKIAGDRRLILSPLYEGLGDAYLTQATQIPADQPSSGNWKRRKDAYVDAGKYFGMATQALSGFASSDARLFGRLSEAREGQAQMDVLELVATPPGERDSLVRERDRLRSESEQSLQRAREILVAGNVSSTDANYRSVMLGRGNAIFGREVGATSGEKVVYYGQALALYQEAAALFPDDPRPFLYEGLCYERLTGITPTPDDQRKQFVLGEAALHSALTLKTDATDYSPALPYRVLASLYTHVSDFRSALDALKTAQQTDPANAEATHLDRDIQSLEHYLEGQGKR